MRLLLAAVIAASNNNCILLAGRLLLPGEFWPLSWVRTVSLLLSFFLFSAMLLYSDSGDSSAVRISLSEYTATAD